MPFCSDRLKMNYTRCPLLLVFLIVLTGKVFALERIINVPKIMSSLNKNLENTIVEKYDSNKDGRIDYIILSNSAGVKVMESLDYNHDGKMDDLYFYSDGVIIRREVDSNYDMNIDLWVYIKDGTMIEKYEQDLDFDGSIDKVKVYGED